MQFRKHQRFTILNKIRLLINRNKLNHCGRKVWFDGNVKFLRYTKNISISNNVAIKEGARLLSANIESKIEIGENTTIGYHTFIVSSKSIKIGKNCLIAPFVYIIDDNHQTKKGININSQDHDKEPIIIGNDVWIGTRSTILKGVKIGNGAVVASGSVVTSDIEENAIYGGIPAKKISERK